MTTPTAFQRYRPELEAALRSFLSRQDPPLLYRMVRYHLGWEDADGRPQAGSGGKALRPVLCLLSCEAVGGAWPSALPAAVALELVHNFSLVHDDIQDRDRERRHRPTVWAVWGEAQAINAGDALLAAAQLALAHLPEAGVPHERAVAAAQALAAATLEMVEGQVLDLQFEGRERVSLDEYLDMVSRKTGALFDAALRLGAMVGCDRSDVWEAMGRVGRLLGLAFQVRDDMLGVWGQEERTGKPAADVRRRKKGLPVVYALSQGGPAAEAVNRAYASASISDQEVGEVVRALEEAGARDYCLALAREKKAEALATLSRLDLSPEPKRELEELAEFLLEREF
ncbi:MAG TPA: polyprenyl synthetase family protein [Dehalococcoidia bacterium]|nr:polyprenyl synthetase family protein [Dehalococcoidia bacterium]